MERLRRSSVPENCERGTPSLQLAMFLVVIVALLQEKFPRRETWPIDRADCVPLIRYCAAIFSREEPLVELCLSVLPSLFPQGCGLIPVRLPIRYGIKTTLYRVSCGVRFEAHLRTLQPTVPDPIIFPSKEILKFPQAPIAPKKLLCTKIISSDLMPHVKKYRKTRGNWDELVSLE